VSILISFQLFYITHDKYIIAISSNLMAFMFYSPQGAIFSDSLMI